MKKLLTISIAILLFHQLYCQIPGTGIINDSVKLISGSYYFTQNVTQKYSPQFLESSDDQIDINKGNKITVLYEINDTIYFKYWFFNEDSSSWEKYNNDKIFTMAKNEFIQISSPLYRRFKGANVGAYTIPFRLRDIKGKNFDFESSLSLQTNLVFGYGSRKDQSSFIDYSVGIGLTSVNLNSKNSLVTEDRTASAFTLSTGVVFRPSKFANIGIFIGWDYLGQKDREINWIHDGDLWMGLGINISFNEVKTSKSATKDSQ